MNKKKLLQTGQHELKIKLSSLLEKEGYCPIDRDGFLYAEGTVPVLLVAHLDTVHKECPKHIWTSVDGDVWKAEEGIGGDDRCGVYAVMQLIKKHHVHVLFCEDEERGGIGAEKFIGSAIRPDVCFMIEFDRKGSGEAVFYGCDQPEFTKLICDTGFKEAWGSFSDISILAPALGIAAANVSCGFHNAHTKEEYIIWSELKESIAKLDGLLSGELRSYPYAERKHMVFPEWLDAHGSELHWWELPEEQEIPELGCWRYLMPFDGIVHDDCGGELEVEAVDQEMMIDEEGMVYEAWGDGITYLCMPELTAYDAQTGMKVRYSEDKAVYRWTEEY